MNDTLSVIDRNQNLIGKKIENLIVSLNDSNFNYSYYSEIQEMLSQMKINFKYLHNVLTHIESAISFARLKTLHNLNVNADVMKKTSYNLLIHITEIKYCF